MTEKGKGKMSELVKSEREHIRIAVVGFSVKKERPIANKKFDEERKAAAYTLEVLLRKETDFISVRKIRDGGDPTEVTFHQ